MNSFHILDIINEHIEVARHLKIVEADILHACQICHEALQQGHKILLAGNGGSAADAQHIAAELVGRFETERRSLPALALTVDTSALTAISNDYGFDHVFARQIEGLGNEGDVFIGISTSGNSPNIIKAVEVAQRKGLEIIVLSGRNGGILRGMGMAEIIVPSDITARIQEMHILVGHILCGYIDDKMTEKVKNKIK
jgi:D-sedoheptulose 7-phosphate isomerase